MNGSSQGTAPREVGSTSEDSSRLMDSFSASLNGPALTELKGRIARQSRQAADALDSQARSNPWLFVGVAAAVAALLGFLLGRTSRR
jgi:ElaB/YqjD/DUF883 family membrane-anchored ribosome-binding protein